MTPDLCSTECSACSAPGSLFSPTALPFHPASGSHPQHHPIAPAAFLVLHLPPGLSPRHQMMQLEKAGASPGFHKVEFTELLSSTRNCTKSHRIMQQQPNKCHQLREPTPCTDRSLCYSSSQRCPLSTQHCAISSKGAIFSPARSISVHITVWVSLTLRNGSALIVSKDLKADTQLRTARDAAKEIFSDPGQTSSLLQM